MSDVLKSIEEKLAAEAKTNRETIRAQRQQFLVDSGILDEAADAKAKLPEIEKAIKDCGPYFTRIKRLDLAALPSFSGVEYDAIQRWLNEADMVMGVPGQLETGFRALEQLKIDIQTFDGWGDQEHRERLVARVRENFGGKNSSAAYIRTCKERIEEILEGINRRDEYNKARFPKAGITTVSATPSPARQPSGEPKVDADFNVREF